MSPTLHSPLFTLHSPVGSFLFSYSVGAVLLGIGLLIGWTWRIHYDQKLVQNPPRHSPVSGKSEAEPQFVGRITGLVDCRWAKWSVVSGQWSVVSESEIPSPKSQIPNQELLVPLGAKYNLTSGFMEITYDTGAKVILQGPCTYEVESASGGFLSLGKLTARVETKIRGQGSGVRVEGRANRQPSPLRKGDGTNHFARPSPLILHPSSPHPLFSVRTPTAVVTDLGTEFGVEVTSDRRNIVSVFKGQVELRTGGGERGGSESHVVSQGQSAVVDHRTIQVRISRSPEANDLDTRFARRMPPDRPTTLSLLDVVMGGNGSGRALAEDDGPNPSAMPQLQMTPSDRRYHTHPIASDQMIDGVFAVLNGDVGPVQLDSVGHVFDGFFKSGGTAPGTVGAGRPGVNTNDDEREADHSGGTPPFVPDDTKALNLRSNRGITFDLVAICRAHPSVIRPIRFRSLAGVSRFGVAGHVVCLGVCQRTAEIPPLRTATKGRRDTHRRETGA